MMKKILFCLIMMAVAQVSFADMPVLSGTSVSAVSATSAGAPTSMAPLSSTLAPAAMTSSTSGKLPATVTQNPMVIQQISPLTSKPNPVYAQMDDWMNDAFGIHKKYLKNTDVIDGQQAYFIVSRDAEGTVTISKRVTTISGKELILFLGQKAHLQATPRHPAMPDAVIAHFGDASS